MSDAPDDPAVIAPPDPADRPPRFRWRLLPTVGCGLFGGLSLLGTLAGLAMIMSRINLAAAPPGTLNVFAAGIAMNATGGLLWIAAAICWWRGRWRWAAGLSVLGFAFFAAASSLP
ncbi:hypothetical protein [Alienimonas sp. DA493]|uniref:hypothetical protein n=1 Tax=Alienimonas sp. DA493 TaxID=3373605 RepID=UPI003754A866